MGLSDRLAGTNPQTISAKTREKFSAAGKNQDLRPLGSLCKQIEHPFHSVRIGVRKSIIQDDRCRLPSFEEHVCKGKTGQNRDLFLCAYGQTGKRLCLLPFTDDSCDLKLFVAVDCSSRKQHLEIGGHSLDHRSHVTLLGGLFSPF